MDNEEKPPKGEGTPQKTHSGREPREKIPNNVEKESGSGGASAGTPSCIGERNGNVLVIEYINWDQSYDHIAKKYEEYGNIKEIRLEPVMSKEGWRTFISYSNVDEAKIALKFLVDEGRANYTLIEKPPTHLEVYYPSKFMDAQKVKMDRKPDSPEWLIATSCADNCNLIKMSKYLQRQVGGIDKKDITRFGRKSVLIHAKSPTQSIMLSKMKIEPNSVVKEIKPHYSFSYAKGVIYDRNVYEFTEEEILDMSDACVWKVFKVPNTNLVTVTFKNSKIPPYLHFENIRSEVRPFKPRPLQCFNCFGFGHPSRACTRDKLCMVCSKAFHGECSGTATCANCKKNHSARDKICPILQKEQEAVLLAQTSHINLGFAKKLLAKSNGYADALGKKTPSNTQPSQQPRNQPSNAQPSQHRSQKTLLKHHPRSTSMNNIVTQQSTIKQWSSHKELDQESNSKACDQRLRKSLSLSQLQVHPAPQASPSEAPTFEASQASPSKLSQVSSEAPQASPTEATQASFAEASQPVSSPVLGKFAGRLKKDVSSLVEIHQSDDGDMETSIPDLKRSRTPSSSPPPSPSQSPPVPTSNRYGALASENEALDGPVPHGPSNSTHKTKSVNPGGNKSSKNPPMKPNISRERASVRKPFKKIIKK